MFQTSFALNLLSFQTQKRKDLPAKFVLPACQLRGIKKKKERKDLPAKFDFLKLSSSKNFQAVGLSVILHLAFQSIGIVYGDIGTSPLYVYASTFTNGIKHNDDILGVLSLIFYTLTLIPLVKYVFIVLRANDNGEGTIHIWSLPNY